MGVTASGSLYSVVWPRNQSDIQVASFDFAKGQFLSTPAPVVNTFVGKNSAPNWSPDGKYLAYVSRRSGAVVIGIRTFETGQVRELSSGLARVQSFAWAPDGGSFIATGQDSKHLDVIYRIDAQTGQSSLMVSRKEDALVNLMLSPDGKTLYYGQRINLPGATAFAAVKRDLASATETELLRQPVFFGGALDLSPDGRYIAAASVDPSTKSNTFLIVPTTGGEPTRDFWIKQNGCNQTTTSAFTGCQGYGACAEPVVYCVGNWTHTVDAIATSNIWSFFNGLP